MIPVAGTSFVFCSYGKFHPGYRMNLVEDRVPFSQRSYMSFEKKVILVTEMNCSNKQNSCCLLLSSNNRVLLHVRT